MCRYRRSCFGAAGLVYREVLSPTGVDLLSNMNGVVTRIVHRRCTHKRSETPSDNAFRCCFRIAVIRDF